MGPTQVYQDLTEISQLGNGLCQCTAQFVHCESPGNTLQAYFLAMHIDKMIV